MSNEEMKENPTNIPAIAGGTPIRQGKPTLYYGKQLVEEDDIQAVAEVLRSPDITCGPKISELEEELCRVTGARYAVACSNGTAALHMACMAAGITKGDEVIVSSLTFAASANCVLYCGATPVFADIREDTYNIDIESIKEKITPRTRAIIAVDFTGQAVQLKEILALCREHRLLLIEDAAHSLGTKYMGRPVGSIADITTFSFHPVKTVTCGEGGACTTNNTEIALNLALLRSHGITRNKDIERHPSDDPWYNEQVLLGFNYRMTDFQAAMLLSQLKKLDRFVAARAAIREKYNKAFADIPQLILQTNIPESETAQHLYILRLNAKKISCNRRQFFDALCAEGIHPQVHYLPVYRHSFYESIGYAPNECPVANKIYYGIVSIPLYPALTEEDTDDVIAAVKRICEYFAI